MVSIVASTSKSANSLSMCPSKSPPRSAGSFGLAAGIGISAVCESSAVAAMEILPHSQVAARVALRTATASQARRSATQHRASRIALPSPILSTEEGAAFGARDRLLHTVRGNFRLEAYQAPLRSLERNLYGGHLR